MDACTYESITGLKNYYGFKSLLKNGAWTQRYSCDDDTIVFNRIKTYTFSLTAFNLASNQIAVIINSASNVVLALPGQYIDECFLCKDVENQNLYFRPNQNIIGQVFTQFVSAGLSTSTKSVTFAIFDLY